LLAVHKQQVAENDEATKLLLEQIDEECAATKNTIEEELQQKHDSLERSKRLLPGV
jgi:hypothetical protein